MANYQHCKNVHVGCHCKTVAIQKKKKCARSITLSTAQIWKPSCSKLKTEVKRQPVKSLHLPFLLLLHIPKQRLSFVLKTLHKNKVKHLPVLLRNFDSACWFKTLTSCWVFHKFVSKDFSFMLGYWHTHIIRVLHISLTFFYTKSMSKRVQFPLSFLILPRAGHFSL